MKKTTTKKEVPKPEAADKAQPFHAVPKVEGATGGGCALPLRPMTQLPEYRSAREKLARELDMLINREAMEQETMTQLASRFNAAKEQNTNTKAEIKLLRWQLANT